jgi:DNA-binding response OmpR family regulator
MTRWHAGAREPGKQSGHAPAGRGPLLALRLHSRGRVERSMAVRPRWVLIADRDGPAARRLVRLILQLGLRAFQTARGDEALRLAEAEPVRLAVIDAALQDMAGPQLALRLRTLDPALPVIMTTGDFRPEIEVQARRAGVLHYAHKPLDDARLEAVLRKVLGAQAGR